MPKGIRGVQDESLELKINTGKGGGLVLHYPLKKQKEEEEENDEKEE